MTKRQWRLLDTGVMDAPYNMALEKVLLTARANGYVPDTLHFLEFTPCALLGYNQAVSEEINEDYCQSRGIVINRRVSGGGCIYMDGGTLGWELIAKKDTPGIPGSLEAMYRELCGAVARALSSFGVDARYRPLNDIEVDGRKISGAGGSEEEDSFIFHGTVLVDFDADTMIKALKLPLIKLEDKQARDFKTRTVCLRELLGFTPPMGEVKKRVAGVFAEVFDIEFEKSGLCREEIEMLGAELPFFRSREWIYAKQAHTPEDNVHSCEYKAEGGLIRVALSLDGRRKLIKSAFITGDFFAYPQRGVLALESALRNASCGQEAVAKRINAFFASGGLRIPGATPEDFISAVNSAVNNTVSNAVNSAANNAVNSAVKSDASDIARDDADIVTNIKPGAAERGHNGKHHA